jgi:hypothetical protein
MTIFTYRSSSLLYYDPCLSASLPYSYPSVPVFLNTSFQCVGLLSYYEHPTYRCGCCSTFLFWTPSYLSLSLFYSMYQRYMLSLSGGGGGGWTQTTPKIKIVGPYCVTNYLG